MDRIQIQQAALDTMHRLEYAAKSMLVSYYVDGRLDAGEPIHFRSGLKYIREVNAALKRHGIALLEEDNETA